ncbi:serine protease FAM111A isoform X5 [Dicentrarchus labrax]|uniref:Protein FAM111A n=1 Tax=Dicentrarchus labrax TaxID=13489 RepID=A0A8C4DA39_DICLA|nr:serine protease FAM111A isoform X5 [Dicentrarchus labrax]XP_051256775.1 serine protease FAM111A isoform X5 [Dicentrarchus labrax]
MEPKSKPKSEGSMDKSLKEEEDCQKGESSQPPLLQPAAMEEEPHTTHTFEWCWNDKKPTTVTCNKARTVEELLKRSSQFKEIAEKNTDKELVILREGKAISLHFPCSLIKDERLTVKYVKAVGREKQSLGGNCDHVVLGPSSELVMFHVLTKGGKNVAQIMRNPAIKIEFQEITVYAYKGEKVKRALKRDGRLRDIVFKKNCCLSHKSTDVTTEMSSLVDDLDGEIFKIILLNKSAPPESQPGSLDDAYMIQNESLNSESDRNQDPPQESATTESVNSNTPKEKLKVNDNMTAERNCEIPNSKTMKDYLSSQFESLVKGLKTPQSKLSRIQNLFRVEFGKNAQTCAEVKTMKKLMKLSDSVCQVRVNGSPEGSGFLLFDKFVLTNGHVMKVYDETTRQLNETVTVHFSFESLDQQEEGQDSGSKVEEVTGFEFGLNESGQESDWALLRLGDDQTLPNSLLAHFGFLTRSKGICIIGHPDGGVKKIDPCLIVPTDNRIQVVERHYLENQGPIQCVTPRFFESVAESVEKRRQVLTYESCFYFFSSGSPVFDEHCNVVAMHTGGYAYPDARGETQSVIEYGHPLSVIIVRFIVQLVERGRFDVLKKYLSCSYVRHQNLMSDLKKLVESRNLTAFKNAVNNSEVTNDESLMKFFGFISQKEEPVPMDID